MTDLFLKDLDETDIIKNFSCGNENIDLFLKNLALSNQKGKFSKTYVFISKIKGEIAAFFSLSASQLNTGNSRIFGIDKIPVILLGRLGVDRNYQGKNL